jgi:hypothetical protein
MFIRKTRTLYAYCTLRFLSCFPLKFLTHRLFPVLGLSTALLWIPPYIQKGKFLVHFYFFHRRINRISSLLLYGKHNYGNNALALLPGWPTHMRRRTGHCEINNSIVQKGTRFVSMALHCPQADISTLYCDSRLWWIFLLPAPEWRVSVSNRPRQFPSTAMQIRHSIMYHATPTYVYVIDSIFK